MKPTLEEIDLLCEQAGLFFDGPRPFETGSVYQICRGGICGPHFIVLKYICTLSEAKIWITDYITNH